MVAVALMMLVRAFLVQSFSVPSGSMQQTLEPGDRILVTRLERGPSIERGDVVVFDGTDTWGKPAGANNETGVRATLSSVLAFISLSSGADYVKRVVGVPGDHIVCCAVDGRLTVNGVAVDEPYLYPGNPPSTMKFDVIVPAGKIWVMGDHRSDSEDSRFHDPSGNGSDGAVPIDAITGRAVAVVWPLGRAGWLSNYSSTFAPVGEPTGALPDSPVGEPARTSAATP